NQHHAGLAEQLCAKRSGGRRNPAGILQRSGRATEALLQTLEDPGTRYPRVLPYKYLAAKLLADCAADRHDRRRIQWKFPRASTNSISAKQLRTHVNQSNREA